MENKPQLPVFEFIFGILDRIFKDASGKMIVWRVTTILTLAVATFIWTKGDQLMILYRESKYETYDKILQQEKDKKYESSSLEQLQIAYISSGADFSAVYSFRPRNLNYFVDLIAYEGRLPSTLSEKNLGGYPVDKTSDEYSVHLSGRNFTSTEKFSYLPTKEKETNLKFMYSCPIFNLDNVYSGSVSMYWYTIPEDLDEKKLGIKCNQASRVLGRIR